MTFHVLTRLFCALLGLIFLHEQRLKVGYYFEVFEKFYYGYYLYAFAKVSWDVAFDSLESIAAYLRIIVEDQAWYYRFQDPNHIEDDEDEDDDPGFQEEFLGDPEDMYDEDEDFEDTVHWRDWRSWMEWIWIWDWDWDWDQYLTTILCLFLFHQELDAWW